MTTDQMISTFDQADLAQFDDDGGAPTTRLRPQPASTRTRPAEPTFRISGERPRLSLTPVRGQGSFAGAWWPQTLRLAHELPGLVTALSTADETITRVSVNGDAWTDIPGRLAQPGRPTIRGGCWFRTLDPHVVTWAATNPPSHDPSRHCCRTGERGAQVGCRRPVGRSTQLDPARRRERQSPFPAPPGSGSCGALHDGHTTRTCRDTASQPRRLRSEPMPHAGGTAHLRFAADARRTGVGADSLASQWPATGPPQRLDREVDDDGYAVPTPRPTGPLTQRKRRTFSGKAP